ncbi:proton-conducting transporter membrane subunit [Microbulbifer variabilis]|uniref:proton-conducting transporter transmembrane domain-containing protein n=1 Tax=Microbulbifer variabilis TaxID=266805 RepID=UPI001CFEF178|nr:proton-conducting transporter membrane subunit [Microbulbifer variabilis]
MVYLSHIFIAVLYLVGANWALCSADAVIARQRSMVTALIALMVASMITVFGSAVLLGEQPLLPAGPSRFIVLTLTLLTFSVVSFAPLQTHRRQTFSRIFTLMALALGFFATTSLWAAVMCWSLSAVVAWLELKSHKSRGIHRMFAWYQFSAAGFFLAGALLFSFGAVSPALGCFLLAISLRSGVFPWQSWFTHFFEKAPMGIVIAYVIPQFGFFSELMMLQQENSRVLAVVIASLGALTAFVAALLGIAQQESRRALAYLILSQSGLLTFGFAGQTELAVQGALLCWFSLALSCTSFALLIAVLEARRGRLLINRAQGNFSHTPRIAMGFLLAGFASVGFPLTLGFAAEDILLQGTISQYPWLSLMLAVAMALNGFNVLRMFFMLFTGRKKPADEVDIGLRENIALAVLLAPLFLSGLLPQLALQPLLHAYNEKQLNAWQRPQPTMLDSPQSFFSLR